MDGCVLLQRVLVCVCYLTKLRRPSRALVSGLCIDAALDMTVKTMISPMMGRVDSD
jgi:hypothetical protein